MGPFSLVYSVMLSGRKFLYTHLKKPDKLPARVISIGNLTLGGTGKTPAVIAVCQEAERRGLRPCVLTRGYKGKSKGPSFVSRGNGPVLSVQEAGDEPYLMAEKVPRTPVVVGRNRYRSGMLALRDLPDDTSPGRSGGLFILDDGFQHLALHRDTDVLLFDATQPFWKERLFPEGRLREPLPEVARAHIIIITKADIAGNDSVAEYREHIQRLNPVAKIYTASHKPVSLIRLSGETQPPDSLLNKRIYAFSGIANPSYFKATISSCGAEIEYFRQFRDHHRYSQLDIDTINRESSGLEIVTTEKDLVKLRDLTSTGHISALTIEFSVEDDFYNSIFAYSGSS